MNSKTTSVVSATLDIPCPSIVLCIATSIGIIGDKGQESFIGFEERHERVACGCLVYSFRHAQLY